MRLESWGMGIFAIVINTQSPKAPEEALVGNSWDCPFGPNSAKSELVKHIVSTFFYKNIETQVMKQQKNRDRRPSIGVRRINLDCKHNCYVQQTPTRFRTAVYSPVCGVLLCLCLQSERLWAVDQLTATSSRTSAVDREAGWNWIAQGCLLPVICESHHWGLDLIVVLTSFSCPSWLESIQNWSQNGICLFLN